MHAVQHSLIQDSRGRLETTPRVEARDRERQSLVAGSAGLSTSLDQTLRQAAIGDGRIFQRDVVKQHPLRADRAGSHHYVAYSYLLLEPTGVAHAQYSLDAETSELFQRRRDRKRAAAMVHEAYLMAAELSLVSKILIGGVQLFGQLAAQRR